MIVTAFLTDSKCKLLMQEKLNVSLAFEDKLSDRQKCVSVALKHSNDLLHHTQSSLYPTAQCTQPSFSSVMNEAEVRTALSCSIACAEWNSEAENTSHRSLRQHHLTSRTYNNNQTQLISQSVYLSHWKWKI